MPTYEYKCLNCKKDFEFFQGISEEPLKLCPNCNTENLERLFSLGGGILFKGTGFYLTDYKNSKSNSKSENPSKSDSK